MNLPAFTGFQNENLGTLFPILFVTVACGAVSGFHSLVSSGTSSKTISNEKDMLKVGYGAMVLESLLAVIALCVAGAAASADGTAAVGTPFQIFSSGVAGFLEMFHIPVFVAQSFMTMCVPELYDHVRICPGFHYPGFCGSYRPYVLPGTVQRR